MSPVDVHNEWDPLQEVIIGRIEGARIPAPDWGLYALEYQDLPSPQHIPSGPFPQELVELTAAELDKLEAALTTIGVSVRRPEPRDKSGLIATPGWQTDGLHDYCPRDVLTAIGDMIIEAPMVERSRFLEPFAYKSILVEYLKGGARWISAPKPQLLDEIYDPHAPEGQRLRNLEPAFDAANILRFGTDILYLVSDSGNALGARWLQSTLGDRYTVHACDDLFPGTHVDPTILPLRPGLLLLNPSHVTEDTIPGFLRGWDRIWAPAMADLETLDRAIPCSEWIGMNLLVVRPGVVIVDDRQHELIKTLEQHRVDTIPLRLTHCRTLGGSFHCVSLDVRRTGTFETYR
jgi:scyllo-inosamine-4-phosphate amidinotransferase 1